MKNDPFYLFSKEKASLGILSADGNFEWIISYFTLNIKVVKNNAKL